MVDAIDFVVVRRRAHQQRLAIVELAARLGGNGDWVFPIGTAGSYLEDRFDVPGRAASIKLIDTITVTRWFNGETENEVAFTVTGDAAADAVVHQQVLDAAADAIVWVNGGAGLPRWRIRKDGSAELINAEEDVVGELDPDDVAALALLLGQRPPERG